MATSEGELIFPALSILFEAEDGVGTTDLMNTLRHILELDEDDIAPLQGRNDDHFSQKVRNLKSHDTLERLGYARFDKGKFFISDAGKRAFQESATDIEQLYRQGFDRTALSNSLRSHPEDIVIEEGEIFGASVKARRRSRKLRDFAIQHFKGVDGALICHGCDYDPTAILGDGFEGLIEIHHTSPIALFPDKGEEKSLKSALEEVVPLCALCHRLVHLKAKKMLTVDELRQTLRRSE